MIGKKNKTICLFTSSFPYGDQESYLISEVQILSQSYNKVLIFPMHVLGNSKSLPENVEVVDLDKQFQTQKKVVLKFNFRYLVIDFLSEMFFNQGWKYSMRLQLDYLIKYYFIAFKLFEFIKDENTTEFIF